MRLFAGTSGFSYREWIGSFYPEKIRTAGMLRFYAEHFPAVEINQSFRRMPGEGALQGWLEQVPSGFLFALKAPQRITHMRRLRDVSEPLDAFLRAAGTLGNALGPILFQLPPNFKKDLERLRDFLLLLPPDVHAAFEFRHESWFEDDVYDALCAARAALCIADTPDLTTPFIATADWGYLRMRRVEYTEDELADRVARVHAQAATWARAFVFFMHEETGTAPRHARRFTELLGATRR